MPFLDASFDLIVCQAAFKNFPTPVTASDEMRRVLRPGGRAVVHDMSREATGSAIEAEVRGMQLGALNAWFRKRVLGVLWRRAFWPDDFRSVAGLSAFGACDIESIGIGMEVRLFK
jgi:ubiquinone/menaquinone biosynthesis C-methylase UbiE